MKILFTALLALMGSMISARAQEFTYNLIGVIGVKATDNAVSFMSLSPKGQLVIAQDGTISGQGVLVFHYIKPCQWVPPFPQDAYNCTVRDLEDGAFEITGQVTEWINQHDDENPLKDAVFSFAEPRASERPGLAPYRISLTLILTRKMAENLILWGLAGGKVEQNTTEASTAGALVSGLFGAPFEIIALPVRYTLDENFWDNVFEFEGQYTGGTDVEAGGLIYLTESSFSDQDLKTDPEVYGRYWNLPYDSPAFSEQELAEMQITQPDSRAESAEEIQDSMNELIESGRIPLDIWLRMADAFGAGQSDGADPGMDPILLEALEMLVQSGNQGGSE